MRKILFYVIQMCFSVILIMSSLYLMLVYLLTKEYKKKVIMPILNMLLWYII